MEKGTIFVQTGQSKAVSDRSNCRIVAAAVLGTPKGEHVAVAKRRWGTMGIQHAF